MLHPGDEQIDECLLRWNSEGITLKDARQLAGEEAAECWIGGNFRDVLGDVGLALFEQLGVAVLKGEVQALDAVLLAEILGHELAAGSLDSLQLEHPGAEADGVCIALGNAKHRGVDERDEQLDRIDIKQGVVEDDFGFSRRGGELLQEVGGA